MWWCIYVCICWRVCILKLCEKTATFLSAVWNTEGLHSVFLTVSAQCFVSPISNNESLICVFVTCADCWGQVFLFYVHAHTRTHRGTLSSVHCTEGRSSLFFYVSDNVWLLPLLSVATLLAATMNMCYISKHLLTSVVLVNSDNLSVSHQCAWIFEKQIWQWRLKRRLFRYNLHFTLEVKLCLFCFLFLLCFMFCTQSCTLHEVMLV